MRMYINGQRPSSATLACGLLCAHAPCIKKQGGPKSEGALNYHNDADL